MTAFREYPCSSDVKGDHLHVWPESGGTGGFGFQTTSGHTAFLNPEQVKNLVRLLEGNETITPAGELKWIDLEKS